MLMPAERIAAFARAKAASLRPLAKHGDVDFIQDPETGRFQGSRPHGHGDAKYEVLTVHLPSTMGGDIEVLKNPPKKDLIRFVEDYERVRIMRGSDGNLYAWDASATTHDHMAMLLDLKAPKSADVDTLFIERGKVQSELGNDYLWNDAAPVGFVSPNIGNLNFDEALAGLDSKRQEVLRKASRSIDDALGKKPIEATSVVGAWADGAENSLMLTMPLDWTREQARVALAMKGWIGDQKSVLLFTPALKGESYLASLSLKGSLGDIHRQLLQDGLTFHTLEPTADGATVYVYGDDQGTADTIDRIAGEHDTQAHFTFGRGEFIGTKLESGSDREQRDDARREYEAVIGAAEARAAFPGRDVGEAWQALRDRWGRELAEVKSALAAVAAAQAHQSIGIHFRWRQAKGVALLRLSNEQRHAIARRKAELTLARLCKHGDVDFIQDPQSGRFQGSRPHGHADDTTKPLANYKPGLKATDDPESIASVAESWYSEAPLKTVAAVVEAAPATQKLLGDAGRRIASKRGVVFKDPGVKSKTQEGIDRIAAKMRTRKNTVSRVTDVVRAAFVVEHPGQVDTIVADLSKTFEVVLEPWRKTGLNYLDRAALVRFPNGIIGEIQFMDTRMADAKRSGYTLYAQWRAIDPNKSAADAAKFRALEKEQQALYGAVIASYPAEWKAVVGRVGN